MKKNYLTSSPRLIAGLLFLLASSLNAQTVLVNFGGLDASPDLPQSDGVLTNWNSVGVPASSTFNLGSVIDSSGNTLSGVSIGIANFGTNGSFSNDNSSAVYGSGPGASIPSWIDTDALEIPLFGNNANPSTVTIAGLTASAYQIDFVATRSSNGAGTQRLADYQVNGSFADSTLSGDDFNSYEDGWINASILTWDNVAPLSGQIVLSGLGAPNSHFTAMRITAVTAVPEVSTISLILGFAGFLFIAGKKHFQRNRS